MKSGSNRSMGWLILLGGLLYMTIVPLWGVFWPYVWPAYAQIPREIAGLFIVLLVATTLLFVAMRLSQKPVTEASAGSPPVRFPYTIAFRVSAVLTAALILAALGFYFFGTPLKLRGSWRRFTTADGLADNNVNAVTADPQGNVWFATDKGGSVLTPRGFWAQYRAGKGIEVDWAVDLLTDGRGRVWVATVGGGVSRFDGLTWRTFTFPPPNGDRALRLAIGRQGSIWVLLLTGLGEIRPDDTVVFEPGPFSDLHEMTIDAEGHIWVSGFLEPRIAEYDPESHEWNIVGDIRTHVALSAPYPSPPTIWAIAADPRSNSIWIATDNIVEVNDGIWQVHQAQYEPRTVFVDADGFKWLGVHGRSDYGLLLISPDNRHSWFWRGGLNQDGIDRDAVIRDVTCDMYGNVWFASWRGVVRLSPYK